MPTVQSGRNWRRFAVSLIVVLTSAAAAFLFIPPLRDLVVLAVYTVPSHMFVSPFPHEPVLLYFAKTEPALWCAVASTVGALIAGLWDYWLFIPLIHHPRVRSKYVQTRLYSTSVRLFRKSPFWALVILGFTPLPFYPIKFLSLADGYPMWRYLSSLVVGRTPRYYVIAYLGYVLKLPNWLIAGIAFTLLLLGIYQYWKDGRDGAGQSTSRREM